MFCNFFVSLMLLFAGTTKWISTSWPLLFFVQSLYLLNSLSLSELIFSLLPLQYCSNLPSISSANILVFQWKNWILHNFSFIWKVAAAAASFSHTRPRGASASMELLYEVTDALNLRCNFNSSHHSEYLLKMDSTTDFSRYLKASYLSEKGLHHQCLYSKT